MKVNIPEMEKQRREYIIKTGKYAEVHVTVGQDTNPVCNITVKGVGNEEVALLIATLNAMISTISKTAPYAAELSKQIEISGQSYDAKNNKVGEL